MSPETRRVLCLEDNLDACALLRTMLRLAHCEAVTVHTATEALERVEKERFDLYLLDSRLPDASGLEVCRRIRALRPHTPIIFVSALAFPGDIQAGLAAGANAYLVKPIEPEELLGVVNQLLHEDRNRLDPNSCEDQAQLIP